MKKKNKNKFKIGDKVKVPIRFGETGTIIQIDNSKPNPYGVEFHNLPIPLFYNESELVKLNPNEPSFSWFRMPYKKK